MRAAARCVTAVGAVAALLCCVSAVFAATPQFTLVDAVQYTLTAQYGASRLYTVNASDAYGDVRPLLIDLHGSRYDMGYAYGRLLGAAIEESYSLFIRSLLPDKLLDELAWAAGERLIDWQWDRYLSAQLPQQYKDELRGIADGAAAAGFPLVGRYVTRIILLANAPGDPQDFLLILMREANQTLFDGWRDLPHKPAGFCSMFALWGSRTRDGSLYSARNLDWTKDSGINRYKLVAVFHPDDGGHAHATFGFAALYGALAGMSEHGLSVHEANLEEDEITFDGFPWVLRLRYIMENAANLAEARKLWASTNNTVGFNHMVASAADLGALVMETKFDYTAYFGANDPREAAALFTDPTTKVSTHIGAPMAEAVWRTNHGYDPVIMQHFEWSMSPSSWSVQRYFFIHDAFVTYATNGVRVGDLEAVNVTSIVADKGKDPYVCQAQGDGSNILSVTFHPSSGRAFVAWEAGAGATWQPACCASYLTLDLGYWFALPTASRAPVRVQHA